MGVWVSVWVSRMDERMDGCCRVGRWVSGAGGNTWMALRCGRMDRERTVLGGCVGTVQGCCGDNQEVWVPQGVTEHPVVGIWRCQGCQNPLLGMSRGQDNFSPVQCGSPGVG